MSNGKGNIKAYQVAILGMPYFFEFLYGFAEDKEIFLCPNFRAYPYISGT